MKILENRAKPFYKLKIIKILKRNITGLREDEILKITQDFSQEKKQTERKNDTVRSDSIVRVIVRFGIRFPLSIFVTVALLPTLLYQNLFAVDVSYAYEF